MLKNIFLWFRIIRPQTLFASVVPVLVATIVVKNNGGEVDDVVSSLTIFCALSLQVLSNLINDHFDYVRGTDKAGRKGFKRALAESEITTETMLRACYLTAGLACLLGLYLVWTGGVVVLAIGLSALLFAWLYTATRYSLSYLGIADIFVYLYYGVIATMGTSFLLLSSNEAAASFPLIFPELTESAKEIFKDSFYAGSVSGFISMCVLLINNIRDIDDDRKVGKRTLPVRFGKRAGEVAMFLLVLLMPFSAFMAFGWSLPVLVVVPAFFMWLKTLRSEGPKYNKCLVFAGIINLFYLLCCLADSFSNI